MRGHQRHTLDCVPEQLKHVASHQHSVCNSAKMSPHLASVQDSRSKCTRPSSWDNSKPCIDAHPPTSIAVGQQTPHTRVAVTCNNRNSHAATCAIFQVRMPMGRWEELCYCRRFQTGTSCGQRFERESIREALLALSESDTVSSNWCMSETCCNTLDGVWVSDRAHMDCSDEPWRQQAAEDESDPGAMQRLPHQTAEQQSRACLLFC